MLFDYRDATKLFSLQHFTTTIHLQKFFKKICHHGGLEHAVVVYPLKIAHC